MPLVKIHITQIQIVAISIVSKWVLIDNGCFRKVSVCRLRNPDTALVSDLPLYPPHGVSSVKLNSFLIWGGGWARMESCCQTPLSTGHKETNGQLMSRPDFRATSAHWGSPDPKALLRLIVIRSLFCSYFLPLIADNHWQSLSHCCPTEHAIFSPCGFLQSFDVPLCSVFYQHVWCPTAF